MVNIRMQNESGELVLYIPNVVGELLKIEREFHKAARGLPAPLLVTSYPSLPYSRKRTTTIIPYEMIAGSVIQISNAAADRNAKLLEAEFKKWKQEHKPRHYKKNSREFRPQAQGEK